jgi:murein DD-endopeptidase MepM/ murein hydrolase activator NlpD
MSLPLYAGAAVLGLTLGWLLRRAQGSGERIYWPIVPYRGTISPFKASRVDRWHAGVDIGAFNGDRVIAMGDGEVLWPVTGFSLGGGLEALAVRHADADFIYAEVMIDNDKWKPGMRVRAGDQLGVVRLNGDGNSMLHLEAWEHGTCPKGFVPWDKDGKMPHGLLDVQALIEDLRPKT